MFQHTKLVYYLWVIIVIFCSTNVMGVDTIDDSEEVDPRYTKYQSAPAAPSSLDSLNAVRSDSNLLPLNSSPSTILLDQPDKTTLDRLKEYFNPTILNVLVPRTAKQIVGGVCAAGASFCAGQVGAPLVLGGLGEVGLTPQVLPFSIPLLIAAFTLPVVTGVVSAYNGAAEMLTYRSPELIAAQEKITHRAYSKLESWVYSPANKLLQLMLFGGLMSGIISNFESNVTGWGPTIMLSLLFSLFFLIPTYFNTVASTNYPNKHPHRHHESEEAKKNLEDCVEVVTTVKEAIKDGDIHNMTQLASHMNILFAPAGAPVNDTSPLLLETDARNSGDMISSSPTGALSNDRMSLPDNDRVSQGISHSTEVRLSMEAGRDALHLRRDTDQELSIPNLNRPRYLKVWDEMVKIYNATSVSKIKRQRFKENVAMVLSDTVQVLGYPMRTLATYGITYKLLNLGFSPEVSMGGGIITTVLMAVPNALGSYKEIPLTRDEFLDLMNGYPPDSPPYWGARIASGIAVFGAVGYFILNTEYYLRHLILEDVIGIHSLGVQLALVIPFLAGTPYASSRQFFSKQLSRISNWASVGFDFEMSCCKFRACSCCDSRNKLTKGQELLKKVDEIKSKTENENAEAAGTHRRQLFLSRDRLQVTA